MAEATRRMSVLVGLVHSAGQFSTGFSILGFLPGGPWLSSMYRDTAWYGPLACAPDLPRNQNCSTFILPSL